MTNIEHHCELCGYKTSKKSSYMDHLNSKKHLKQVNGDNVSVTSDMTETTDYCIESSFAPTRQPVLQPLPQQPTYTNNDFQIQLILQEITLLKSQNLIYQNEISNLKSQVSSLETKVMILSNNEIQAIKTAQQMHSITENIQQIQTVSVPTKKVVSNKQIDNTVISNTEIKETATKPVKPTLTEYLNTTCNDAGDFEDFRRKNPDIDINKIVNESHLKELPNAEESLTNYVMMTLKHTPIEKIPFRCIDVQNKTCVIKVKGKWYLASDEYRESFVDWARTRLNEHYFSIALNSMDEDAKKIEKTTNKIKQYESVTYLMKGETEDRKMGLMEKFDSYENFNVTQHQDVLIKMNDRHSKFVNFASSFPDVKKTFMETLQKEVLKYIKIDMRHIEMEDLPMYYQDVVETTTEPIFTLEHVDEPEPVVESTALLFSRSIIQAYKITKDCNDLSGEMLEKFVKMRILSSFGMNNFDKTTPKYFETSYSKEELLQKMEFLNTIKEVSNILSNDEVMFKGSAISDIIEQLIVENSYVEST